MKIFLASSQRLRYVVTNMKITIVIPRIEPSFSVSGSPAMEALVFPLEYGRPISLTNAKGQQRYATREEEDMIRSFNARGIESGFGASVVRLFEYIRPFEK